jgi:hypothetical protein
MEHSLHLGAGHFVKGVAPTLSRKILKKVQHVAQNTRDGEAYDIDQLDAELADIEDRVEGGDEVEVADDEDNGVEYDVADSIGKALALVNQVSILVLRGFCAYSILFRRFASHRKQEPFLKSHVMKWMFCSFNFYIGSRPDGPHCSTSLIGFFSYNKYV